MEDTIVRRGAGAVENTAMAPAGSATGELLHFDNHAEVARSIRGRTVDDGHGVIHNEDAHPERPLHTLQSLREDT